ncbi:MAG: immunoglobulin domain-containing protein, partial [Rhodoferax sp.]|nr:immunoglobulin domain-containing protein [Rhodoferax sp.]
MALAITACGGGATDTPVNPPPTNPTATAPSITAQPENQSVVAGETATFKVLATGSATLSYQWQKGGINVSGGTGATSNTYTTPATAIGDNNAVFTVVVSNNVGSVTSTAMLTVTTEAVAPSISSQPAEQLAITGQAATFSVTATGTGTLAYQWLKNGADIAGATSSTYTIAATSSEDSGAAYSVRVSNSQGTVTSSPAMLTVSDTAVALTISAQPAAQSVTEGQAANFSVTAKGTGTLRYQWIKNGADIVGATSRTYTTPVTSIADNGAAYSVRVSNSADQPVTSGTATLTVNPVAAPTITVQPATAQTVTDGQSVTFSVTATGTGPLVYQWKKGGNNIPGANSSTYTLQTTSTTDSGVYSVEVSNSAGPVTSSNATLTVSAVAAAIGTQPA